MPGHVTCQHTPNVDRVLGLYLEASGPAAQGVAGACVCVELPALLWHWLVWDWLV